MEILLVLAVLAAAVFVIAGPLRASLDASAEPAVSSERAELDASKEAKFREIRDAELDYRTGKLSHADWALIDSSLRAEAVDVLRQLDALEESRDPSPDTPDDRAGEEH
jgi:hypothetical protein